VSIQFKFKEAVGENRRREIVAALERAGFAARPLFPGQKRPRLAAIFTVSKAQPEDLKAIRAALSNYGSDIDYIEAAPERKLST
jgi:hypothetical protein